MTRVAVLDLGTNTFHLLIADVAPGIRPTLVYQETIAVKLGEGGISKGYINQDAFDRGIKAIKKFKIQIDNYLPEAIKSAATSAIRSASNGVEFIDKIKDETSIELDIIDGDIEANLIYLGVRAAVPMTQNSLIVDIGGGSVEFIICDESDLLWKKSFPIGAARLMDQFHHSDPISSSEISEMITYLESSTQDLKTQLEIYKPELMIGSAGAFETFALLQDPEFKPSFESPEFNLDLAKFRGISEKIIKSTHAERVAIPQIPPVRVDMIVVAAILTQYIIKVSGIKELKLSGYSLKEGLLLSTLDQL